MKLIHTRLYIFFMLILLLENFGCQNTQEHTGKNKKDQGSQVAQPGSASGSSNTKTRKAIIYFSGLIEKKQFFISKVYREYLTSHPKFLRENISSHGQAKSIFHHPIRPIHNTLVFNDLKIEPQTTLRFSVGIFTNDTQTPDSDGATFQIVLKHETGETVLFQQTVNIFDTWNKHAINLSEYAGKKVNIKFKTTPVGKTQYGWTIWGSPRIVYGPQAAHSVKTTAVTETHEFTLNKYRNLPSNEQAVWIERGWPADAVNTDILLDNSTPNVRLRQELLVVDYSNNPEEELELAYLDKNDRVLASSLHPVSAEHPVIQDEFIVKNSETAPAKIRVTLSDQNPSVIFIKKPIFYALNDAELENERPNVILISLDTLRADRLGCYGHTRETSPNIDALAAEGFLFTNAYSNSNWTLPAHMSMFNSRYPAEHQIELKQPFIENFSSEWPYYYITEAFKELQYLTMTFSGGVFVSHRYGFDKGMDYHLEDPSMQFTQKTLDYTLSFIQRQQDIPKFIFFHTYEVHEYHRERAYHRKYIDENFSRKEISLFEDILILPNIIHFMAAYEQMPFGVDRNLRKNKQKLITDKGIQYLNDLYDSAVFYTDDLLGQFFTQLRAMELYDNSWIILTSDHGEGLGESHNAQQTASWYHGARLYDNQIKIPLIIKPPKNHMTQLSSKQRIDRFVQTIDIPPTLAAIIAETPHEQFKGENLLPLLANSNALEDREVFSENINKRHFSAIKENFKLIMTPRGTDLINMHKYDYQLYHLSEDAAESTNLSENPRYIPIYNELHRFLWEHIGEILDITSREQDYTPTSDKGTAPEEIDAEHIQQLKDLGYL